MPIRVDKKHQMEMTRLACYHREAIMAIKCQASRANFSYTHSAKVTVKTKLFKELRYASQAEFDSISFDEILIT